MEQNDALKNFNINDLDPYERRMFDHHVKSMSKEEALQVIINDVEGDTSQLSTELARIADEQMANESDTPAAARNIISYEEFSNASQRVTENDDINEASGQKMKMIVVDTSNFTFSAVYPANMDDEKIKSDFLAMSRKHMKQMRGEYDREFWNTIVDEMNIVEIPVGTWFRDYDKI